jgi:hypothetical protein
MSTTVSHPIPTAQAQAIADLTGYEDAATLRWQQACVQAANTLTALPNGRYVNVRMERMRQGLELAQRGAVTLPEDGEQFSAVVRSGNNVYQVDTRLLTCPCADYQPMVLVSYKLKNIIVHTDPIVMVMHFLQAERKHTTLPGTEESMTTTTEFITALFCQVDDPLAGLPKHPEAHLWPSEVVTLGLLHALKGVGNRPF